MLIATNLLGLVVRGLFHAPVKLEIEGKVYHETPKRAVVFANIFFLVLNVGFFYSLYYFWNYGVVVAAALIMISRLPDLLYEIKTGIKATSKSRVNGFYDYFFTLLFWSALPVLWYSLCRM